MLRALAILLILVAAPARAAELILDFDSLIVVHPDSTMTVTETIQVIAEGREIRRGIVREFPTTYRTADGRRVRVGFTVEAVERNGAPEPFRVESEGNGRAVYIGRREVLLEPGRHVYTIRYRTTRQLGFFPTYDELYWNVTGTGWIFPILRAGAEIVLPAGATVVQSAAYTGPMGATGRDFVAVPPRRGGAAAFATTRPLQGREGLTVAVGWPKGFVTEPGGLQQALYLVRDHREDLGVLVLFLMVLGYFGWSWWQVGRDPPRGTIIPLFAPPQGLSPAAARYLRRMAFDSTVFAATIVNLAVHGCLRIEDAPDAFRLQRLDGKTEDLDPLERAALLALMPAAGSAITLAVANQTRIGPAQTAIQEELARRFQPEMFVSNLGRMIIGFILSIVAVLVMLVLQPTPWILVPAIILLAAANLLFLRLLKAPTPAGRKVMDEIEGFRMYLSAAEQPRLEVLHPPDRTPALFERYLPYALALGVEQQWAEQFAAVLAAAAAKPGESYAPGWYDGRGRGGFRLDRIGSRLGGALAAGIASSATPPGKSSGSSGGGFSGGGGGGGGGRGW